jgi:hypothetical protein
MMTEMLNRVRRAGLPDESMENARKRSPSVELGLLTGYFVDDRTPAALTGDVQYGLQLR